MSTFLAFLAGALSGMWLTCLIVSGARKQPQPEPPVLSDRVARRAAIERLIQETRGVRP
jgi:hypothetical protein